MYMYIIIPQLVSGSFNEVVRWMNSLIEKMPLLLTGIGGTLFACADNIWQQWADLI